MQQHFFAFEIGFDWVCFFGPVGGFIFIILYNIYVCAHFGLYGNWV